MLIRSINQKFMEVGYLGYLGLDIEISNEGYDEDLDRIKKLASTVSVIYIHGEENLEQIKEIKELIKGLIKQNPFIKILYEINSSAYFNPLKYNNLEFILRLDTNKIQNQENIAKYNARNVRFIFPVNSRSDLIEVEDFVVNNNIFKHKVFIENYSGSIEINYLVKNSGYNLNIELDGGVLDE